MRDHFSDNLVAMFHSLVLCLLNLLQEMKIALDTGSLELFVLVVGVHSGQGSTDILHDGTNLLTPVDTQQAHEPRPEFSA